MANRAEPRDIALTLEFTTEIGTAEELAALVDRVLKLSEETHQREWESFGLYSIFPCRVRIEQPI